MFSVCDIHTFNFIPFLLKYVQLSSEAVTGKMGMVLMTSERLWSCLIKPNPVKLKSLPPQTDLLDHDIFSILFGQTVSAALMRQEPRCMKTWCPIKSNLTHKLKQASMTDFRVLTAKSLSIPSRLISLADVAKTICWQCWLKPIG